MTLAKLTESELFDMLKAFLIPDLEPRDITSKCDAYSEKYSMAIELKCRRAVYDDVLIEKSKYDFLRCFANSRYIISDASGIYSFNIGIIEPLEWYIHYMPATTDFLNNEKIVKTVGYISKRHSINITNKLTNETNYGKI